MYQTLFSNDLFAELDRLQQEMRRSFVRGASIRGFGRGGFPAINIGHTAQSVELYVFVPGLDPAALEVNLERGVLTIAGERMASPPASEQQQAAVHVNERFDGRFRRVVNLPDDMDPDGVSARYADGLLHITVKRRESAQPRRIAIH